MSREGVTQEEYKALDNQMRSAVKELRDSSQLKLNEYVRGYGENLRGTSFEFMLEEPKTDRVTGHDQPVGEALSELTGGAKAGTTRRDIVDSIRGGGLSTIDTSAEQQRVNPLTSAAQTRVTNLQNSSALIEKQLSGGALNITPELRSQAEARMSANKAEIKRVGLLEKAWEMEKPASSSQPKQTDWRNDPEYLSRRHSFQ